jgi:hypothetical protein
MKKPAPSGKTTAGTLTGLFAASALPGAIVHVTTPIESLNSQGSGSTTWDVDGDFNPDFRLDRSFNQTTYSYGIYSGTEYIITSTNISTTTARHVLSSTEGGGSILRSEYAPVNLALGAQVGPTTGTGPAFGYYASLFSAGRGLL